MGTVFNIQHFSIHDGPGIRTVVFLKGCPLKCKWCANPESQKKEAELAWTKGECIGCRECVKKIGDSIVRFEEDSLIWDTGKMYSKEEIEKICPSQALHVIGKEMTSDEVIDEVKKDIPFFNSSGGGITISGGEPLLQSEFTYEILKRAGELGLHRTIETSSCAAFADYEKVAGEVDYLISDVKVIDDELHKEWTGASNKRILENLRLIREGFPDLPIQVRTPVIPSVNDTKEAIKDIIEFVNGIGADFELLKYHRLGLPKYESLHRQYPMGNAELSDEKFHELESYAIENFAKGAPGGHYGPAQSSFI